MKLEKEGAGSEIGCMDPGLRVSANEQIQSVKSINLKNSIAVFNCLIYAEGDYER